jgi:protocatechuate 3,4-dioxygenase beta subunit
VSHGFNREVRLTESEFRHATAVLSEMGKLTPDTPGDPLLVSARVVDGAGKPVAGAEVDFWHAWPIGVSEIRDREQADMNLRGKFTTDEDARFWLASVKMVGCPIPNDGIVGRLLQAQNRHPFRPAHLRALIVKEGFKVLISQVYDPSNPHIDTDPSLASRGRSSATMSATRNPIRRSRNPSALVFPRPHLRHRGG